MIKLTQQQQAVLIAAAAHPGVLATRPEHLKHAAAAKLAAKLVEHKLAREVRAKDDGPIWREDKQGRALSLKLLKSGHTLAAELLSAEQAANRQAASGQVSGTAPFVAPDQVVPAPALALVSTPADGEGAGTGQGQTKRTLVLSMLARGDGATLEELIAATGWLPHTTRAALSRLRQGGIALERSRRGDGASAYRGSAAPAAATVAATAAAATAA